MGAGTQVSVAGGGGRTHTRTTVLQGSSRQMDSRGHADNHEGSKQGRRGGSPNSRGQTGIAVGDRRLWRISDKAGRSGKVGSAVGDRFGNCWTVLYIHVYMLR